MTAQTRATLKGVFEQGDVPQGSDFADLIDSAANVADTTAQSFGSDIQAPKLIATTEVSSPSGRFNTLNVSAKASVGGGTALMVRAATVLSNNSGGNPVKFLLPNPSNATLFFVDVEIPFATGVGATAARINVNIAGSADSPIVETVVSASGRYDLLTDAGSTITNTALLTGITATVEAFVSVASKATAFSSGQALFQIWYY